MGNRFVFTSSKSLEVCVHSFLYYIARNHHDILCICGWQVRVISVPGISMELCGGTHVRNIAEIRGLKIMSEQGIASGVRRIEAVAGNAFIEYINARDAVVKQLSASLKV